MQRTRALLFTLALSASAPSFAQTTWFVDASGTAPGSGLPNDPYTSIQFAIAQPATLDGDSIVVASGTYVENLDFLGKDLEVRGGGIVSTFVDGNDLGPVVTFENGESAACVLEGFTLRNGRGKVVATSPTFLAGGGIHCANASPTLRLLAIEGNEAHYGAGAFFASSTATLSDCAVRRNSGPDYFNLPFGTGIWSDSAIQALNVTVEDNGGGLGTSGFSANEGGGVYGVGTYIGCLIRNNRGWRGGGVRGISTSGMQLIGCTISNNVGGSVDADSGLGGGVHGPATLTSCTIDGNRGAHNGGGTYDAHLIDCVVSNNLATTTTSVNAPRGGGAFGGTLVDCTVFGNVAGQDLMFGIDQGGEGGGVFGSLATRCTIRNNTAHGYGSSPPGLYGGGGAAAATLVDCDVHDNVVVDLQPAVPFARGGGMLRGTATRCRIWNNTATKGGGAADATLFHCTLFGNTATDSGGALAAVAGPSNARNCIFWGNSAPQVVNAGGSAFVTYSDVQGGQVGIGNIDLDPLFVNAGGADFHLLAGSPCINTGDPTTFDPDGSRADMGAFPFECDVSIYCVGKVNSQGCTPAIASSGTTSLSGTDDFVVTGSGFVNQKTGILFWGRNPASVPFQGGTLCVAGGLVRTAVQNSGGNPLPPPDCSGTYAWAFTHAYMSANAMLAYQTIHAQWYSRDPLSADGTGVSLSNALAFTICP